jgi:two-component system cell cycle response regulator
VMMPGMDGFELCRRLKRDPASAHVPVVMVTALSDGASRLAGLEAGADDFLTKPLGDTALFARIRSLLRLKIAQDEFRRHLATAAAAGALDDLHQRPLPELGEHGCVLVVTDVPGEAAAIEQALAPYHHVTPCPDPAAAPEAAASSSFDLVVVSLPKQDDAALRLCSLIRSREPTRALPLVIVVPDDAVELAARALDLGVNDYVARPVDRNEIIARVRNQIRRYRYQQQLRADYHRTVAAAVIDSLTGLFNRRYLVTQLVRHLRRAAIDTDPLALLMIDIDRFKSINDTYGHHVGDEVLRGVAERLKQLVRPTDFVARYGGEEFVAVMPRTDEASARVVADRLCSAVRESPFPASCEAGHLHLTVSAGLAVSRSLEDTPEGLLKRADRALYEAKSSGRNRVALAAA